jgi:hypothetical protein
MSFSLSASEFLPPSELLPTHNSRSFSHLSQPSWIGGMTLSYGLYDRGIRVLARAGNFSLNHRVQTGSGAQLTSYTMGIRVSFPGGKAAGA